VSGGELKMLFSVVSSLLDLWAVRTTGLLFLPPMYVVSLGLATVAAVRVSVPSLLGSASRFGFNFGSIN
jgi:hypothetical protein